VLGAWDHYRARTQWHESRLEWDRFEIPTLYMRGGRFISKNAPSGPLFAWSHLPLSTPKGSHITYLPLDQSHLAYSGKYEQYFLCVSIDFM